MRTTSCEKSSGRWIKMRFRSGGQMRVRSGRMTQMVNRREAGERGGGRGAVAQHSQRQSLRHSLRKRLRHLQQNRRQCQNHRNQHLHQCQDHQQC